MANMKYFELKKAQTDFKKQKITTSHDAYEVIKNFYGDDLEIYESFFLLLLDRSNKTIGFAKISQGGMVGTVVDVKIIMQYVLQSMASGIVVAHNHPSGSQTPSKHDIKITAKIKHALKFVDSVLLDHLILTTNGHYSFENEKFYEI